jgi:hypothetical protein
LQGSGQFPNLYVNLSQHEDRHVEELSEFLYSTPDYEFKRTIRIRISQSPAIDAGGVFRDKIGSVFQSLLDSDIFIMNEASNVKTFRPFINRMGYQQRKAQYVVFGKIYYWFVIVRRCIPFPNNMDPAILAYGIYGDNLPTTCLEATHPLRQMVETVLRFTNETQRDEIIRTLEPWREQCCINLNYAVTQIMDVDGGRMPFLKALFKNAVFNDANDAFEYFREGFIGEDRAFPSVYHLRGLLS